MAKPGQFHAKCNYRTKFPEQNPPQEENSYISASALVCTALHERSAFVDATSDILPPHEYSK